MLCRRICAEALRNIMPVVLTTSSSTRGAITCRPLGTLSHVSIDEHGSAVPSMVDVSAKVPSKRTAVAQTIVSFPRSVLRALDSASNSSNAATFTKALAPVFTTAIIGGVQGAKKTSELIPFCHPIPLEKVDIQISRPVEHPSTPERYQISITCTAITTSKTGVEMEALTGVSTAALCFYDMCKAASHDIEIESTKLVSKTGGKSAIGQK